MTSVLISSAIAVVALMIVMWLLSIPLRNAGIIDIVWGLGFAMVAWITLGIAMSQNRIESGGLFAVPSAWLLPALTTLWGVRLSAYLAWRNIGHPEDKRYAAMREARGSGFWWQSLFLVFLLQAALMWIISLPLQFGIAFAQAGWSWLHAVGLACFTVGLTFETVADWQLVRFKSQPENRGRVLDRGLWRYTRHPNYFGDFCVWWGLYLIAIAHGENLGTIISPLLMSVLLMRVSGVTLLERSMSQKPEFAAYAQRTSAFFPRPPRPSAR